MTSSSRPAVRPVYRALHRPLTVCGVDRRLFFLALLMGAATFNLFYSFLAGSADVQSASTPSPLGDEARSADAAHPAVVVPIPRVGTTRRSTRRSRSRCAHAEDFRRILRDYQEAGSLNSLLALWGFVDDHTFLTKAGHVGVVYRLAGVDYECRRSRAAARHRPPIRSRAATCSTSRAGSTNTCASVALIRSRPHPARSALPTKRSNVASTI